MDTKEYIISKIKTQFSSRYIWVADIDIQNIYKDVINGSYAFKIVYEECDKYDIHIISESFKLDQYCKIDYRLISEFSKDSDIISIDGGKRYQWNKREIIFIDPTDIRDFKLSQIGI